MLNVAIFGSCVSRDTAAFVSDFDVIEYVARHSLCTLTNPYGQEIDTSILNSQFQRRMIANDLHGAGLRRLASQADSIDLVMIDLIDERRGYWKMPGGSVITNSIEAEAAGVTQFAERNGARLVKFGTSEHYEQWLKGAEKLVGGLKAEGLLAKTVFLDIEWAAAFEGRQQPVNGFTHYVGKKYRKTRRQFRELMRALKNKDRVEEIIQRIERAQLSRVEEFQQRAKTANRLYRRYSDNLTQSIPAAVIRKSVDLRIAEDHKWGAQPFHYRETDYQSIVYSIREIMGV